MTGLKPAYVAVKDPVLRDRMKKALFFTASNIASVVQDRRDRGPPKAHRHASRRFESSCRHAAIRSTKGFRAMPATSWAERRPR